MRRIVEWAGVRIGEAGATAATRELFGAMTAIEAIKCGRAIAGPESYGAFTVHVGRGERARARIGAYCSMAEGVSFVVGGNQRVDRISTFPFRVVWDMPGAWSDGHPRDERDVVIGNEVWIGRQALILPGVVIGDGAVVGARAVVARTVRPYAIVVGNPAREIRRRFTDDVFERLLDLRWWDWPEEKVRANVSLSCASDVEALLTADEAENGKGR